MIPQGGGRYVGTIIENQKPFPLTSFARVLLETTEAHLSRYVKYKNWQSCSLG